MPYLTQAELHELGLARVGRDVLISDRAALYNVEQIELGDFTRIDDFCLLNGPIVTGRNVHIAAFCNLAGGGTITLDDFAGLAYGCHIIAQTDDYSGQHLTNPTVPAEFTSASALPVSIGKHVILGTGTIVLPGVDVGEGVSTGSQTLLNRSTDTWAVYVGSPARRLKDRSRDLLTLEAEYRASEGG